MTYDKKLVEDWLCEHFPWDFYSGAGASYCGYPFGGLYPIGGLP